MAPAPTDLQLAFLLRAAAAVFLLLQFCAADDALYRNCTRLFSCGEQIRGIDYPFWGGDRPPECGVSRLKLQCDGDNSTTIEIAGERFRVLRVSLSSNSMKIVRSDLFGDICSEIRYGASPSVGQYSDGDLRLRYSPEVRYLSLLYNCPDLRIPKRFQLNCTNRTYAVSESFVAFKFPNGTTCEFNISVPVLDAALQDFKRNATAPTEVVREGFEVEYRMNGTTSCDTCQKSDGLCWSGTNSSQFSTCLCADGPHHLTCLRHSKRLGLKIGIGM